MARQSSFDIVSRVDAAEVQNAVNQAMKEVRQRYDLKGSGSEISFDAKEASLTLHSRDEYTLSAVEDVLKQKLVRRGVSLKAIDWGRVEPAAGGTVRRSAEVQQGIPTEKAREIVQRIKKLGLKKVQASIQEDSVRVTGRERDALQEVIAALREADLGIDMQFVNYRSQ